jgi:hypothetical protein
MLSPLDRKPALVRVDDETLVRDEMVASQAVSIATGSEAGRRSVKRVEGSDSPLY